MDAGRASSAMYTLMQILAAYRAAVLAADSDALVALYDDEVEVFDLWRTWRISGIAAWRATVEHWLGSLGEDSVVVDARELGAVASDELIAGHATLRFTAVSPEGIKLRSLDNRLTVVLRRRGGQWKIVHEHTSAPIDFSSLTAILEAPDA